VLWGQSLRVAVSPVLLGPQAAAVAEILDTQNHQNAQGEAKDEGVLKPNLDRLRKVDRWVFLTAGKVQSAYITPRILFPTHRCRTGTHIELQMCCCWPGAGRAGMLLVAICSAQCSLDALWS
jgi:hypothetical protein